jgi:hypothetical protein
LHHKRCICLKPLWKSICCVASNETNYIRTSTKSIAQ